MEFTLQFNKKGIFSIFKPPTHSLTKSTQTPSFHSLNRRKLYRRAQEGLYKVIHWYSSAGM